jgi:hypothetical protein
MVAATETSSPAATATGDGAPVFGGQFPADVAGKPDPTAAATGKGAPIKAESTIS